MTSATVTNYTPYVVLDLLAAACALLLWLYWRERNEVRRLRPLAETLIHVPEGYRCTFVGDGSWIMKPRATSPTCLTCGSTSTFMRVMSPRRGLIQPGPGWWFYCREHLGDVSRDAERVAAAAQTEAEAGPPLDTWREWVSAPMRGAKKGEPQR